MPVDAEPHPEGNVSLGDTDSVTPRAVVLTKAELAGWTDDDGPRYMPHFVTCTNPPRRRK